MKPTIAMLLVIMSVAVAAVAAEDRSLSLVSVQPLFADRLTVTGRVQPVVSARIGPRVSARLIDFGKDEKGRALDAGMTVKAGQMLFQLDTTTFDNHRAAAAATLESAKAALANLTAPTREERLVQLRSALVELDARLAEKKRDFDRYERLVKEDKTLPPVRLEQVQTELAAMQAQRSAAEARLREAETGPTRTEIAVAQARVKEAEAALRLASDDLRDATVLAPFGGVVTRRFKSIGDYIVNMPPTEVIEIMAMDRLEVELKLPEAYYRGIKPEKTTVTLRSSLLQSDLTATVSRVVAEIDPIKGTFPIRIVVPGQAGLVAGAFVMGEVNLDSSDAKMIVPQRAVLRVDNKTVVFVVQDGKMAQREVELGDRLTEGVIVRSGLKANEKIVVGPSDHLQDGAALPAYLTNGN